MKKVDTESLEKMAKQKNIDKDKIEEIADSYKGKSESELMEELIKIGKTLEGKEEVVSKFKTFLDEKQRKKIDLIMNKISEAEVQEKVQGKKSKSKHSQNNESSSSQQNSKTKKNKQKPSDSNTSTKTKKVKKVKKSKSDHK